MVDQQVPAPVDRELRLVVNSLQRLALRVESRFNPDVDEGADELVDDAVAGELVDYARKCLAVLNDPVLTDRLRAGQTARW
jgi:hypothetical protein